jgi:choline dehydrogenase
VPRTIRAEPAARDDDREIFPGADITTDADIGKVIRANATHSPQPVSTCRMGNDGNAVVDSQLRVREAERLRVADASIMPDLPSSNTNLPSIMIGETT